MSEIQVTCCLRVLYIVLMLQADRMITSPGQSQGDALCGFLTICKLVQFSKLRSWI